QRVVATVMGSRPEKTSAYFNPAATRSWIDRQSRSNGSICRSSFTLTPELAATRPAASHGAVGRPAGPVAELQAARPATANRGPNAHKASPTDLALIRFSVRDAVVAQRAAMSPACESTEGSCQ